MARITREDADRHEKCRKDFERIHEKFRVALLSVVEQYNFAYKTQFWLKDFKCNGDSITVRIETWKKTSVGEVRIPLSMIASGNRETIGKLAEKEFAERIKAENAKRVEGERKFNRELKARMNESGD